MRHLTRTHRISVAWLHEQYHREHFDFKYVSTECIAADVFPKSIPAPHTWKNARRLINVFESMDELVDSISSADTPVAQPCLYVAVCAQPTVSAFSSTLHRSDNALQNFASLPRSRPAMAASSSSGGAVTADARSLS